jgi:hypothetical protein
MAVPNSLAYYDMATITAVISFIVQAPGVRVTKKKKFYGFDTWTTQTV